MMKLTPELETKGLKAYEQVRAFEALQRRGLPWIYGGFVVVLVVLGAVTLGLSVPRLAAAFGICAVWFALWSGLNWRKQKARYGENLRRVGEMEALYGNQLPWVQVEAHFAALEKLKGELARERIGAALKEVVEERRVED
jgi:hypothetical protein